MREAPIGRRQTFRAIRSRLASSQPSLVIVSGPAGSGRTHLLGYLSAAAESLGYRVLQGTDSDPVTVGPSTTTADLRRRLQNLNPPDTRQPGPRGDEAQEIAGLFRRLSPLLVLVDGFRPAADFASWLTDALIPRLRQTGGRIAAVVTDNAESLRCLRPLADLAVSLGPLNAGEVRGELSQAATGLSPGLTEEELNSYVEAAAAEPATLSALLTVFRTCSSTHSAT
jgi:hypothetical protein